jgi:hypothetical protein
MQRLKEEPNVPPEPERQEDYFEIHTPYDTFIVTRAMAMQFERRLDQLPPPRWVELEDLSGVRHRIQAVHVYRISESSVAQRAANRAIWRARRLEEKQDRRPWEDDD